jgi:hypothetical protein
MNARREAFERLAGRYETRVLEPSPPAVDEPPWFADDPVTRGEVPPGRQVVSPVGTGDLLWEMLAAENQDLAAWCAQRWLAAYKPLPEAPPRLVPTRRALHRLAEQVVSPARRAANGKIGLRFTRGGFGTPFFGADQQVRVQGAEAAGARAAYGLSPGDEPHAEPYLYVAPWAAPAPGELWQASGFDGAELSYAELRNSAHPRNVALDFFRARLAALIE